MIYKTWINPMILLFLNNRWLKCEFTTKPNNPQHNLKIFKLTHNCLYYNCNHCILCPCIFVIELFEHQRLCHSMNDNTKNEIHMEKTHFNCQTTIKYTISTMEESQQLSNMWRTSIIPYVACVIMLYYASIYNQNNDNLHEIMK